MGELVPWGLGIALGYTAKDLLSSRWRILAFALSIMVLGALITLFSGEMASEPWLGGSICRRRTCGGDNRGELLYAITPWPSAVTIMRKMRPPGTIQASAVGLMRTGSFASQSGILRWSARAALMYSAG